MGVTVTAADVQRVGFSGLRGEAPKVTAREFGSDIFQAAATLTQSGTLLAADIKKKAQVSENSTADALAKSTMAVLDAELMVEASKAKPNESVRTKYTDAAATMETDVLAAIEESGALPDAATLQIIKDTVKLRIAGSTATAIGIDGKRHEAKRIAYIDVVQDQFATAAIANPGRFMDHIKSNNKFIDTKAGDVSSGALAAAKIGGANKIAKASINSLIATNPQEALRQLQKEDADQTTPEIESPYDPYITAKEKTALIKAAETKIKALASEARAIRTNERREATFKQAQNKRNADDALGAATSRADAFTIIGEQVEAGNYSGADGQRMRNLFKNSDGAGDPQAAQNTLTGIVNGTITKLSDFPAGLNFGEVTRLSKYLASQRSEQHFTKNAEWSHSISIIRGAHGAVDPTAPSRIRTQQTDAGDIAAEQDKRIMTMRMELFMLKGGTKEQVGPFIQNMRIDIQTKAAEDNIERGRVLAGQQGIATERAAVKREFEEEKINKDQYRARIKGLKLDAATNRRAIAAMFQKDPAKSQTEIDLGKEIQDLQQGKLQLPKANP